MTALVLAIALAGSVLLRTPAEPESLAPNAPSSIFLPVVVRPQTPVQQVLLDGTLGGEAPAWTALEGNVALAAGRTLVVSTGTMTETLQFPGRIVALAADPALRYLVAIETLESEAGRGRRFRFFEPRPGGGLKSTGLIEAPDGAFDVRANGFWLSVPTRGRSSGLPFPVAGGVVRIGLTVTREWSIRSGWYSSERIPDEIEVMPASDTLYVGEHLPSADSWQLSARTSGGEMWGWEQVLQARPHRRLAIAAGMPYVHAIVGNEVWSWFDAGIPPPYTENPEPTPQPVAPSSACLNSVVDIAAVQASPPRLALYGQGCLELRSFDGEEWPISHSAADDRVLVRSDWGQQFHEYEGRLAMAYGASGGLVEWTSGVRQWALEVPGSAVCLAEAGDAVVTVAGDGAWTLQGSAGGPSLAVLGVSRLGMAPPSRCEIEVVGQTAYVASDALYRSIDLSDLNRPAANEPYAGETSSVVGALAADGRAAYLAAGRDGIRFVPHDPLAPSAEAVDTGGSAWDAELASGYLYVAVGPAGVGILELQPDSAPRLLRVVDVGVDVRTLRADGTRLYGTGLPSPRSHRMDLAPIAFFALDISDPLRPRRVGLLDLPGTEPGRPALTPDYVAVPVGDAVHYLEMSQSGRPTLVRTLDAPAKDAVWVAGTLATALGDVGLGYISAPR